MKRPTFTLGRAVAIGVAAVLCFASLANALSDEEKAKKRQEILDKMERLRQKKEQVRFEEKEKIQKIESSSSENRQESIRLFEQIIASTQRNDPRRCDAFFQLGALYYEDERENHANLLEKFKGQYELWEKRGSQGAPPIEPVASFGRTTEAFKNLLVECPDFKGRDLVYYKLGNIFTASGDFENAFSAFNSLVKDFPESENAPFAHLRIGEYYYMIRDNPNALKHYEAVGMKSGADNYLLSLYRIASCYYNMSQFDNAVERFFEYVELADTGKYKTADFRDEAVEYMAISFSELEDGAEEALNFFKKKGGRAYEDDVIFTVGIKYRDHDKVKEAIKALEFLLEKSPNYIDAPLALKALIDCQILEKKYARANELREKLTRDYGPGSKWMRDFAGEQEKVATTLKHIKEAAAIIPIYFTKLGNVQRDSGKSDKAKEFYQKALTAYDGYIGKFPEEKWNVYTFHFFRADLLMDSLIGRYADAAREFEWVSREDTSRYPSRVVDKEKVAEARKKEVRDIKDQFTSNIQEQVATIQVSAEEAGFAAVICLEKVAQAALKEKGFADSTAYQATEIPEMKAYLKAIKDFRDRFPASKHAAEVAFLESNLYFDGKNFAKAIEGYRYIVSRFQEHPKIYKPSLENLAKAFLNNKQFEDALIVYKRLLNEFNPSQAEKAQLTESIAATIFQIADTRMKGGDYTGAADHFKQILVDFPAFTASDKALYNAAYAYEQGKMYVEASREFERVFDRFPRFNLRKESLLRGAANLKEGRDFAGAARLYIKYKDSLAYDSGAVPCLFRAATMYDSAGDFLKTAKVYEAIFDAWLETKRDPARYPGISIEAPGALYSAGRIYERLEKYPNAIATYEKLEKTFPGSPYTPEAFFSIAICYEKMGDERRMADAYVSYTQKFGEDKDKVVHSLMKAARTYAKIGRRDDQIKLCRTVIAIQNQFGEKFAMDPRYAAEANFTMGEITSEKYEKLDLRTAKMGSGGAKEIEAALKNKIAALSEPLKYYTDCIALQNDEWTPRATYMCGELFWNLMEAVKSQPIVERDPNKIAYGKVKVNEALPTYFEKTMNFYFINVDKFRNKMGVKNEWTDKSAERYAQAWYQMCFSHVENGQIFAAAPNPFPKGTQEYDEYQAKLQTVVDQLVVKCVPCFEEGIKNSLNAGIDNSWVERMKRELERHSAGNAVLSMEAKAPAPVAQVTATPEAQIGQHYDRQKKAIQSVYANPDLSLGKKISILQGIEESAKRRIEELNEEIRALKARKK